MFFAQYFTLYLTLAAIIAGLAGPLRPAQAAPLSQVNPTSDAFGETSCDDFSDLTLFVALEPDALRCGYLTVPEQHANPNGPTIELAVVIIKSTSPNPAPDPLVMAQGGPGGSTIGTYPLPVQFSELSRVRDTRDIVLFDQRGTQYSEPFLFCDEIVTLTEETLEQRLSRTELTQRSEAAVQACRERLVQEGVNLAAFNSLENAADIASLSSALGYRQINLYGVSYGTLLALHTMREHAAILRSVILDAVVPPQTNFVPAVPRTANRSFSELFNACAADAGCNAAYPNLEQSFFDLLDQLDQNPARLSIRDPATGRSYNAVLDGDGFYDLTFLMLYGNTLIPLLPHIIYAARDGDFTLFSQIWQLFAFDRTIAYGMYYSVLCAEDADFRPEDTSLNGVRPQIVTRDSEDAASFLRTCADWNVPALDPAVDAPVVSDIPTLIFNGRFDPITPPSYGEEVARTLSRSYVFTFPALGHGVFGDDPCGTSIGLAFLANPQTAPDGTCISQRPAPRFISPATTLLTPAFTRLLEDLTTGRFWPLLLLGASLLFLLSVVLIWPLAWLIRVIRKRPPTPRLAARLAPGLPLLIVVLGLGFGGGVVWLAATRLLQQNDLSLLVGLPWENAWLFALPLLIALLTLAMLAFTVLAWRQGWWGVLRRIYFSLLTLAALGATAGLLAAGLLVPLT